MHCRHLIIYSRLKIVIKSLQRYGLHFGFDDGVLPDLDVAAEVLLAHVYAVLQDVEEQCGRGGLGETQDFEALMKCAHFKFYFVVLDDGDAHFEQVVLALQQEVVPDPKDKLLIILEAVDENGQEPADQIHPSL